MWCPWSCSWRVFRPRSTAGPPDFCLHKGMCHAALCRAERVRQGLGEGRFFIRPKEPADRQLSATRDQKQLLNAVVLMRDLLEPHPQRVEGPFANSAVMADFAHPQ